METRAAKTRARCTGALRGEPPLNSTHVSPKCLHCGAGFQSSKGTKIQQNRVHPLKYKIIQMLVQSYSENLNDVVTEHSTECSNQNISSVSGSESMIFNCGTVKKNPK